MDKITVYINTLPVHNKSGGIKTFLLELILALAERKNEPVEYHLICSDKNADLFKKFDEYLNFKKSIIPINNVNPVKRIFYEQFKLNRLFKNIHNAVLLNICNIALINCSIPQVTIIQAQMSIAALRKTLPGKYVSISAFHKLYYDLLLNKSIDISVKTICISNYMQQFLGEKKNKTVIIHEGVNLQQFQLNGVMSKHIPDSPYILSLSTLFPHKNIDKLILAYSLLKKKYNINYKLLIVGKDPDNKQVKVLKDIAKKEQIHDDVIFSGWVTLEEIPSIYHNASLFTYISSMEFFGLPVLEAMASNVPVLAANRMSIPEIVNDAGILVDPDNITEVAEKMYLLLTDTNMRKELIENGRNNIKKFQWDSTAAKFKDVFCQAASQA